jgi:hypothetical protein
LLVFDPPDLETRSRKTLTPRSTSSAAIAAPYRVFMELSVVVTVFVKVLTTNAGDTRVE